MADARDHSFASVQRRARFKISREAILVDLRIWAALGIKTNCSEIVYALGKPELVLDVAQP